MLGTVPPPRPAGCKSHFGGSATRLPIARRAPAVTFSRLRRSEQVDCGTPRLRKGPDSHRGYRFQEISTELRFVEQRSTGGLNRMNEKPVVDADENSRAADSETPPTAALESAASSAQRLREALGRVIVGQSEAIDLALVTLLAGGHALVEGVPGVGKTLLVKTLARAVAGGFQRIQFTPDLMPADITGTNVFDLKTQEFRLVRGPIFTNFLLADEINRAPAKTQSALLEAMQERQVTIDRESCGLPPTFVVFATQNPIEHQGTYPLPEAQKDRFLLKIRMGYPALEDENELARLVAQNEAPERRLEQELRAPILQKGELEQLRAITASVRVSEAVSSYIVD